MKRKSIVILCMMIIAVVFIASSCSLLPTVNKTSEFFDKTYYLDDMRFSYSSTWEIIELINGAVLKVNDKGNMITVTVKTLKDNSASAYTLIGESIKNLKIKDVDVASNETVQGLGDDNSLISFRGSKGDVESDYIVLGILKGDDFYLFVVDLKQYKNQSELSSIVNSFIETIYFRK
jgi:hypothetical protein